MSEHLDPDLLSAYLDGAVSPDQRAHVDAHVGACAECAAQKTSLAMVIRSVASMAPVAVTPAETRAIRMAVLAAAKGTAQANHQAVPAGWRQRLSWKLYALAGAAAVLVAGVLGYGVVLSSQHSLSRTAAAGPFLAPRVPNLSSDAEARAYAAAQAPVGQGLRTLAASGAPAATAQFFGMLAATPAAEARSSQPASPDVRQGFAAAPAQAPTALSLPAPGSASSAGSGPSGAVPGPQRDLPGAGPPAPPGTLAACVQTVLAGMAAPVAPLFASEVTYQGEPAWFVVVATAPPGSDGSSLTLGQVLVQSRAACTTLAHSTVNR